MNKVNAEHSHARKNKQTNQRKNDHEDKLTCCQKLAEPRDAHT